MYCSWLLSNVVHIMPCLSLLSGTVHHASRGTKTHPLALHGGCTARKPSCQQGLSKHQSYVCLCSMMRTVLNRAGMADHHPPILEGLVGSGRPIYQGYMHMLCFMKAIDCRPAFGLGLVDVGDCWPDRDEISGRPVKDCKCSTACGQAEQGKVIESLIYDQHFYLFEAVSTHVEMSDLCQPVKAARSGFRGWNDVE